MAAHQGGDIARAQRLAVQFDLTRGRRVDQPGDLGRRGRNHSLSRRLLFRGVHGRVMQHPQL